VSEAGARSRVAQRVRLLVFYVAVALMVAFARPTTLGVAAGFLFVAAGESVRFWAAGHLVKTRELITSGPYRFTRNPLYLGRLLILIGLCVMARLPYHLNWAALAVGCVLFFGYYLPRKERIEPTRLGEVHGDTYQRYHRAVPALLPTLRPYPEGASTGWSSDRMVRNREHWMLLGLALVTLYLLWRAAAIAS
jgi:protein-S-isoprenylcysteine O-methyltransferase Ste14